MRKLIDLKQKRFGKLLVIKITSRLSNGGIVWECRCDCGRIKNYSSSGLVSKRTTSCGCGRVSHGKTHSREYQCWSDMKQRCLNKNHYDFKNYGGRGIKICEKWMTFEGFWEEMKEGYSKDLTLDRIDNNGNYEKKNCRWAKQKDQAVNKRWNKFITIKKETKTVSQWSEILGINYSTLYDRYFRSNRNRKN